MGIVQDWTLKVKYLLLTFNATISITTQNEKPNLHLLIACTSDPNFLVMAGPRKDKL